MAPGAGTLTLMCLSSSFRGVVKALSSSDGRITRRHLRLVLPAAVSEETAEDELWRWTTTAAPVGLLL